MDAKQALDDLAEISSQIQAAVVFDDQGNVAASTLPDAARSDEFARGAARLLDEATAVKIGDAPLKQLEAATPEGSVFVVREGEICIAATTAPEPAVGLVFYDLKSALRQVTTRPAASQDVRAGASAEGVSAEAEASPPGKARPKPSAATKQTDAP